MNINQNAVNTIDVNYTTAAELSASNNGLRDNRAPLENKHRNVRSCNTATCQYQHRYNIGEDKYLENDVEPSNAPWDHFFAGDGRVTYEIIKQTKF